MHVFLDCFNDFISPSNLNPIKDLSSFLVEIQKIGFSESVSRLRITFTDQMEMP